MLKQKISEDLKKTVKDLGYPVTDIVVSIPQNSSFGDYTTNLALQLAKQKSAISYQSSEEIAKAILKKFGKPDYLEKAEVAGGGFINFFIKDEVLLENLDKLCNPSFSSQKSDVTKEKIMVEYTDPNPFKEFHIGHLISNSIGESLSRLFEAAGAEVKRANYFGDVGMHVAKSIWGMRKELKKAGLTIDDLGKKPLSERIRFLGKAYTIGTQIYEEDKGVQDEIKKINSLVYIVAEAYIKKTAEVVDQDEFEEIAELFKKGKLWSLEYLETIYIKLGTKFDFYYPESSVSGYGMELVKKHLEDGIFENSEGAIIFPGEKYGLHRRVFVNSLGLPTYEAKELGLAVKKYQDYPYDRSIIVTGNEIKEYFQVLLAALKQIKPELAKKTTNVAHGMLRVTEGKMSSRKGNVITFEWLFEAVKAKVASFMKDPKMLAEEKEKIIEMVTIGAIKFSMLKSSPRMDIVFDLDKSVSLDGDSGPYLQYSYARARSVLRNADYTYIQVQIKHSFEPEEREILRSIEYFEQMVQEAAESLHPNTVATYLADFAKQFNLFYQKHRIANAGEKTEFRLALTCAVAFILKQGLYLLGIEAPERM